jgi:putative FmdB family regulatory protein
VKYEYECPACGNVLLIIRSIHDIEVDYDCPTKGCGSTVNRKYEAPAISFKGKGFYTTDSKG